jgi:hypothetical protein
VVRLSARKGGEDKRPRAERTRGYDSVAVVGSIIRRISVTLFAGKPLRLACSWIIASSLARDAKGLVGGDVALDPLNIGAEFLQRRVRFLRGFTQGLPFGAADRRKLALDDKFAHGSLPHQKWRLIATRLPFAGKVRHHLSGSSPRLLLTVAGRE